MGLSGGCQFQRFYVWERGFERFLRRGTAGRPPPMFPTLLFPTLLFSTLLFSTLLFLSVFLSLVAASRPCHPTPILTRRAILLLPLNPRPALPPAPLTRC